MANFSARSATLSAMFSLVLCCVPDAYAQFGGMGGGRRGAGNGNYGTSSSSQQSSQQNACTFANMNPDAVGYDLVEDRLMQLEVDMRLADGQMSQWKAFKQSVEAYAMEIARQRNPSDASADASQYKQVDGLKYIRTSVDRASSRYSLLENVESAAKSL